MTRRVGVPALLIAIGTVLTLLGITPALASGAPVIRSFRASQSSIAGSGGRIILSIEVGAADRCALTSTPAVRGLPKMISCRNGCSQDRVCDSEQSGSGSHIQDRPCGDERNPQGRAVLASRPGRAWSDPGLGSARASRLSTRGSRVGFLPSSELLHGDRRRRCL